ncbi:MAG: outer membrane protein assembly factor BamB family protein [Planctomycetota bacterium]|jgi:outer membrane protein assembly factor BamB
MKNRIGWILAAMVMVGGFCGCDPQPFYQGGGEGEKKGVVAKAAELFTKGEIGSLNTLSDNFVVQKKLPEKSPLTVGWTLPFPKQEIESLLVTPARSGLNAVLVLTKTHDLIAIERNSGKGLWWVRLGSPPTGKPVFSKYSIFVIVDGYLLCIESQSGNVLWRNHLPFPPTEAMVATETEIGSPMVMIASLTKVIYGLSINTTIWPPQRGYRTVHREDITIERKNLHVLWTYPVKGHIEGDLSYYDGDLMACDSERRVYGLDVTRVVRKRPVLKWKNLSRGPNTAGLVTSGGYVYNASRDRNIYCYSRRGGGELWRSETGYRLLRKPQVVRDPGTRKKFVFQSCQDGPLLCMTARKGKTHWQDDRGGYIALVDEDKDRRLPERGSVAVVHPDGAVTCKQIKDGKDLWSLSKDFFVQVAENTEDQYLYGTLDGGKTLCMLKRK